MPRRRDTEPATAGVNPARALTLYEGVRQEADGAVREAAATDLAGELVLLRRLLHEQIERDPDGLELTIKAMHLLVRMVTAQHNLTKGEAAQLSEEAKRVLDQFSRNILGLEAAND